VTAPATRGPAPGAATGGDPPGGAAPDADLPAPDLTGPRRLGPTAVAFVVAVALLGALSAWHLTQGTSGRVGAGEVLRALLERAGPDWDIVVGSRWPRLAAGLLVGAALGAAGAAFQSIARNPLASPDLLGVSGGALAAVTVVAAIGASPPVLGSAGIAFVGGLAAAALVLAVASGAERSPTRLVLAGAAVDLLLTSVTLTLFLLFEMQTGGLLSWSNGSLLQLNLSSTAPLTPVVLACIAALVVLGGRLDLLALGDDPAASLGVNVARTRAIVTLLAVLLTAAAVTVTGPVRFVGLAAPVIVRLVGHRVPELSRNRTVIGLSAVVGAILVIGSDALLRAVVGAADSIEIPVGVVTAMGGSVVLVAVARRIRGGGTTGVAGAAAIGVRSRRRALATAAVVGLAVVAAAAAGLLLGDRNVLFGDVANWLRGDAGMAVRRALDERTPRVAAALLGGLALAASGHTIQRVGRNPLAEPGTVAVTAGAGLAAVFASVGVEGASTLRIGVAAIAGGVAAFTLVFAASWRRGIDADRLVLIGIGTSAGLSALTGALLVRADSWDVQGALTWLAGSTYGRTWSHLVAPAIAVAVGLPVLLALRRQTDLLAVDDDLPRSVGIRLEPARFVLLAVAVVLAATSVSAVGAVAFVGLVAPHAARLLVGGATRRALPVACLLGALLTSVADTVGRTAIAPSQIPAGLLVAAVGTPYFVHLLWRTRT